MVVCAMVFGWDSLGRLWALYASSSSSQSFEGLLELLQPAIGDHGKP